ncbi:AT-rich interactive domain-containing protein 2 isoform X1 [Mycetomoellerius zeteki]|uniref:AT-rich interactive domain-containing protein 2 isoform X1 n=1 Tax=Mycetomoellerius zeteki TaxID=64791 RepID=UPI00084E66B3|nr:PREDICTED: AT-rich interactive domain-containing protein 2 isoform X1 [Trachymyrmex zeteki]
MAKILNKDPVTYEKERDNFLKDLRHFHETRGTLFKKSPKINGKDIDLYLLYVVVTAHGGWIKVNTRNEWASLCEQFHLPGGCINSGVGLKQIYLRYLDRYEKVHFLGEDGQQADDDDEDSRHRKWSARALHSVPLTYNHHQHNIAESLRDYNGLSSDLYKSSNYDKLALSLLSPLPNEQDFAINVCTLLSNEGKHTLRLDKYPRLMNILLAHAGVFDSPGTRQLFIEVYSRIRNYSINSFWSDVLDSQDVIDLTDERTFMKKPPISSLPTFSRRKTVEKEKQSKQDVIALTTENEEPTVPNDVEVILPDCPRLDLLVLHSDENLKDQNQNSIKFEEEDRDLFCVGRTLGTQDPYGQRVLQIASILRNLSFTPENATILGRNRCFLRFVLLCVRARWSNLHQLGFDILGNIANEVILKEAGERITNVVLTCVAKGIESQDRFIVISCLEVLNKISQQDSNEEIVTFGLADNVYELICRFLALSDIALLVYTLECLYALTSLGERPCTSVARVRGAIDTLVALVTVEAQSYGPKACILMRVVETVSTVAAQQNTTGQGSVPASPATPATTTASTPSTPATITTTPAPASPASSRPTTPAATSTKSTTHKAVETANAIQQQNAHQQIIQENEQFALGWVKATFELTPGVRIEQEELYKKYLGCCTKIGRRGVIAPLHFPRCVRSVFGNIVGPNPLKGENTGTQYYEGIRVRATPAPITYPSQTTAAVATNTLPIPAVNTTPVKVLPVQQRTVKNISPAPDSTAAPQVDSPAASSGTQTTSTPASPILKAQLSAPPKPPSNNTSSQSQNPVTKVDSKSQVSVSHPHLSQALLASGSQTPPPQQQQQPQPQPQLQCIQVVAKEDNRSGTTSSSIIKSLLATKVTVSSDCMPSAAATCVSTPSACVTNTTASIASSISANQLITSNQVAQRQQQQRLLQQQMTSIIQPAAPAATPATILPKTLINTKQKPAITPIPAKKIQRLNGAKFVVTNNCEKTEINDNDNTNQIITSTITVVNPTENHISSSPAKVCRPPLTTVNVATVTPNKTNQRMTCTSIAEDSDSTNNSLASSSGIGGSRDCSFRVEEENMPTSFEGILLNGAPASNNMDIDAQEDGSSKDSSSVSSKDKPLQSMMLVDLLERKVDKEPILNGVLSKNSINEKEMDLVENHIKKVLKESPAELKIKPGIESGNVIQNEVSEDTLIEAPRGIKRSASESDELDIKKPKYSNGTMSPDPAVDSTTAESTVSSIKSEEQDDDKDSEKATVSSTAANLYAALAADCIEDEIDLEEQINVNKDTIKEEASVTATASTTATVTGTVITTATAAVPMIATATVAMPATVAVATASPTSLPPPLHVKTETTPVLVKEEPPTLHIKEESHIFINQITSMNQASQPQPASLQQQQQQLIVTTPRQIVVQQTIPSSNQVIIPTTSVKGRPPSQQPQVLLQQSAGGQLQYVVSGGVPGQNYVLAQPQTALVQGQAQTVLVAQTTQQQGTGTKTIIILQPQAAAQPTPQKMVAVTPQGQQVVVTQVPRPILQSPALGNIPPPLVPTSATIPQASIIVNSSVAQTNPNTVTVTIPAMAQQTPVSTSVPSRVVTPTPASTPPPTRPTTPHQAAATHGVSTVKPSPTTKVMKTVSSSTSTEPESKPSTSQQQPQQHQQQQTPQPMQENKTITIKIDPNAYLCEWRGCLRQFKTPHEVYLHVCEAHCPSGGEEILCLWASCDALKRRKFSLMTHLYDRHCNADTMSMRRKQLTVTGKTEVSTSTPPTPHHPGYAPNAAFHAIKRHALEFVNPKELMQQRPTKPAAATSSSSSPRPGQNSPPEQDDNEGPVTKSIRLTAALILRNLVIYSTHGRRHLRAYEPHLAGVALSNVESSRTIAQVLYDMNDQSSSSHHR